MRPLDARAFCKWLNQSYSDWVFRLPRRGELEMYGMRDAAEAKQEPSVRGYWVDDEDEYFFEESDDGKGDELMQSYVRRGCS